MSDSTMTEDAVVIERTFGAAAELVWQMWTDDENGNLFPPSAVGMPDGYPATSEVTVQLKELRGRTRMVMTHVGVPAESGAGGGWEQAFDKLADHLGSVLTGR